MLKTIIEKTNQFVENIPKKERKKYGQFFTSMKTAHYMASLFVIPKEQKVISVLDAGAGSGILSCAIIERLDKFEEIKEIKLTCYETDQNVLPLLKENLSFIQNQSSKCVTVNIITDNYITSQYLDFNRINVCDSISEKYDLVIGNPPYMKLKKNTPEAVAMSDICYGTPNMYFIFAAMGLFNLKNGCEMVYIMPRSWTSGAYFKRFRKYFLSEGKLLHIHLFRSRNKVFNKDNVLQEIIIVKIKKMSVKPNAVTITTTNSNDDFNACKSLIVPYDIVVSENESYVYLVTNENEIKLLNRLSKWNKTLPELGLRMKTGLIVDFRNRNILRSKKEDGVIPLFYSHHIIKGEVHFPVQKENEYILTKQKGLTQDNKNYLFVKRFTSKEETRRLQCGVYLAKNFPEYKKISTQNKINFIDGFNTEMSECLVYGLYVLFNSTIYDEYYRILNGSTQVNSTEINSMPVPELDDIREMGNKILKSNDFSETNCNLILQEYFS